MSMKRNYLFWRNSAVFVHQHKDNDRNIVEDNFWKAKAGEVHEEKLLSSYAKFVILGCSPCYYCFCLPRHWPDILKLRWGCFSTLSTLLFTFRSKRRNDVALGDVGVSPCCK